MRLELMPPSGSRFIRTCRRFRQRKGEKTATERRCYKCRKLTVVAGKSSGFRRAELGPENLPSQDQALSFDALDLIGGTRFQPREIHSL